MKELDIFFAKAIRGLDQLDNEDYVLLNQLIDESEEKIYSWLLGQEHNSKYKKIIEKILTFG